MSILSSFLCYKISSISQSKRTKSELSTFGKLQGKTLAFVLPIIESITNGPAKASRKTGDGRPPSVLVLLPTRELACQVCTICSCVCIAGWMLFCLLLCVECCALGEC